MHYTATAPFLTMMREFSLLLSHLNETSVSSIRRTADRARELPSFAKLRVLGDSGSACDDVCSANDARPSAAAAAAAHS